MGTSRSKKEQDKIHLEWLEHLAHGYTRAGCSAASAVGEDILTTIQSAEGDGLFAGDVIDLAEGEAEELVRTSQAMLEEIKKMRAGKRGR